MTRQHPVNYFYHLVATQDMLVLLDERFPKYHVSTRASLQKKNLKENGASTYQSNNSWALTRVIIAGHIKVAGFMKKRRQIW